MWGTRCGRGSLLLLGLMFLWVLVLAVGVSRQGRVAAQACGPQPVATLEPDSEPTVDLSYCALGYVQVRVDQGSQAGLSPGDRLRLGATGSTIATYSDLAMCWFRYGVEVEIGSLANGALYSIREGGAAYQQICDSRRPGYRIETLFGTVYLIGTTVGVSQDSGGMSLTVFAGMALLTPPGGQPVEVREGQTYVVSRGAAGYTAVPAQREPLTADEVRKVIRIGGVVPRSLAPSASAIFGGTVSVNQRSIQGMATIEAVIGDTVCGTGAVLAPTGASMGASTFTVEVASAVTQRPCGRDGDTVTFRLRSGDEVVSLQPAATFRAGPQPPMNLTGDGQGMLSSTACPQPLGVSLSTSTNTVTNEVTVRWQASGGCGPFTGVITARHVSQQPYIQYPVTGPSGTQVDQPACPGDGAYTIEYTVELTDSRGQRASARATATIRCIG